MMVSSFVFSHLNLRFNPFGELTSVERARLASVDLQNLLDHLKKPSTAVQFVGDHGRGKSTHLLALHATMPDSAYTQLHAGDKPVFSKQTVQFVDSVENIGRIKRMGLYRLSASIALTSHVDLSRELKRWGYLVHTRVVAEHDPERIRHFFKRRLEFARRGPGPIPRISEQTVRNLIQRFDTDIRAMEHYLYELFQDLKELRDV